MKVGICGLGGFSASFVPLYLAHPDVSEVVLADAQSGGMSGNVVLWIAPALGRTDGGFM